MTYMHRIWMGSPMPERYQKYGELWKELNPQFELHDWTEEEIMDSTWENQSVLDKMYSESRQPGADMVAYYTHVADVVDYELIYRHGGWYFNTDLKPIRPLPTWLEEFPQLAMEDNIHPVNMAMYSPVGHPFFAKVISILPKRYFGMPGAFMNATTGVQLLQQALAEYTAEGGMEKKDGTVHLWHKSVFNPIHWSEFDYGTTPNIDREYPDTTVAVHEWLHRTNQRGQRVLET